MGNSQTLLLIISDRENTDVTGQKFVEYSTPPEKLEAFCEGIRQLIIKLMKWTRKDYFHVYLNELGQVH